MNGMHFEVEFFTFERRRKRDKIGIFTVQVTVGVGIKMLLRISKTGISDSELPPAKSNSTTFRRSVAPFFANEKIMRGLC